MRSLHPEAWTSVINAVESGFSEKLGLPLCLTRERRKGRRC